MFSPSTKIVCTGRIIRRHGTAVHSSIRFDPQFLSKEYLVKDRSPISPDIDPYNPAIEIPYEINLRKTCVYLLFLKEEVLKEDKNLVHI